LSSSHVKLKKKEKTTSLCHGLRHAQNVI